MEAVGFIFLIVFVIVIYGLASDFDEKRIDNEIASKGGTVISKTWQPFGKGWFGEENDRIYEVRYLDKEGNEHKTLVKTSSFSGVYFSDDVIIRYANNKPLVSDEAKLNLIAENERLKKEIEILKQRGH
jgi:hypothetical protein